jgi:hypothetical protein
VFELRGGGTVPLEIFGALDRAGWRLEAQALPLSKTYGYGGRGQSLAPAKKLGAWGFSEIRLAEEDPGALSWSREERGDNWCVLPQGDG